MQRIFERYELWVEKNLRRRISEIFEDNALRKREIWDCQNRKRRRLRQKNLYLAFDFVL
jgi:hypothetical protein